MGLAFLRVRRIAPRRRAGSSSSWRAVAAPGSEPGCSPTPVRRLLATPMDGRSSHSTTIAAKAKRWPAGGDAAWAPPRPCLRPPCATTPGAVARPGAARGSVARANKRFHLAKRPNRGVEDGPTRGFLGFDDAIDGAHGDALGRVVVALALDTSLRIDRIDRVTLGDRLGRAFGLAGSTGDALVGDLHDHGAHLRVFDVGRTRLRYFSGRTRVKDEINMIRMAIGPHDCGAAIATRRLAEARRRPTR